MVVFPEMRSEIVDPDLATEVGVRRVFTEGEFTFGATPPALGISLCTIELHTLEAGWNDIFVDSADVA